MSEEASDIVEDAPAIAPGLALAMAEQQEPADGRRRDTTAPLPLSPLLAVSDDD